MVMKMKNRGKLSGDVGLSSMKTHSHNKQERLNAIIFENHFETVEPSFFNYIEYHAVTSRKIVCVNCIIYDFKERILHFINLDHPYCLPEYKEQLKEWDKSMPLTIWCQLNDIPFYRFMSKTTTTNVKLIKGEVFVFNKIPTSKDILQVTNKNILDNVSFFQLMQTINKVPRIKPNYYKNGNIKSPQNLNDKIYEWNNK